MGKRWTEEETPPPVDLRLVPMAIAVWSGCLTGLWAGSVRPAHLLWWGLLPLVLGGLLLGGWRSGRAAGLAALSGFVAALLISVLQWQSAEHNPLTVAAAKGAWATVSLTVSAVPQEVVSPFPVTDPNLSAAAPEGNAPAGQALPGPPAAAAKQWLVAGRADFAVVADREFDPSLAVTVLATGSQWSHLVPGAKIRLGGLLTPDPYAVLPGVTVKARSGPVSLEPAPWWQRAADSVRRRLVDNASELSGDAGGLLPGLVVGNTDGITPQLKADAKVTGLTHLLAVSGSHFALLCGLAVLLLRGAGPRFAAAGGGLVLFFLVVLVGPGASVLRAAVMGSIGLLAMSTGRNRSALPALAAATIGLLLFDPTLSRSVGFALSVLATGGLILLAPAWSKALQRRGLPSGWADLLAVPAAAFVSTMPDHRRA